jgi:3-deoxy-manno-octulosonate cytidylyltransferase (CMP-KDO synthetase)
LIQHVYERACRAKRAQEVLVATDDSRILAAVQSFGGRAVLTRRDHMSGTDRVAEASMHVNAEIIINLQGDEPLIDPQSLDHLPELLLKDRGADVATLAAPIVRDDQWRNPNCVKVVCGLDGRALYFSRSPIPFVRDGQPNFHARPARFLQHIGLYGFRKTFLAEFASLKSVALEETEKLEQLRILAAGRAIQVGLVNGAEPGVDTYDDYQRFVAECRKRRGERAA